MDRYVLIFISLELILEMRIKNNFFFIRSY